MDLRKYLLTSVLLVTGMTACTSFQWRDHEGVEHHVGLLLYELKQWEYGSQLRRVSFGIDVRLSGADRGISFGMKSITAVAPRVILLEKAEELPEQVAKYYREALRDNHAVKTEKWGGFYLEEILSREVTIIDGQHVGVEWRTGPSGGGASIGYAHHRQLVGSVLTEGVVQVHLKKVDGSGREAIALWLLRPLLRRRGD